METPRGVSSSSSSLRVQSPSSSGGSSPLPPSVPRLWRPAAQRNLRNQWSKLASYRQEWVSSSSSGRSHATSLVNAYLSQKYMPSMELGVLSDMPDIQEKACSKLLKQQELFRSKLLSSYKDMVQTTLAHTSILDAKFVVEEENIELLCFDGITASVVTKMINTTRSMRCYVKGSSSSPIVQFSSGSENNDDTGDGGGIPIFTFWSISCFEQLGEELVQMFISELNLKRLLVMELLNISCEFLQGDEFCWSNEIYPGEFDDLSICNLYSEETGEPVPPRLMGGKPNAPALQFKKPANQETLQVYLTTWLAEVNIDTHRADEIFSIIGEEMHVNFS